MGVNKKTDGRYIVGMGAPNENEYKGSMGWRDIFIQLTENGATPDSEEKLAFLRDYAIYNNGEGNAIMPPSVSVWVSNNGVTSAVNADDITLEDGTYTICGIKWDGSSWDYTNAGQSSGGGGSSLPSYTSSDKGKVLTVGESTETVVVVPEQTGTVAENPMRLAGYDTQFFESAVVGTEIKVTDNGNEVILTAENKGDDFPGLIFSVSDVQMQMAFLTSDFGQFTAGLYFMGTPGAHTVKVSAERPAPSAVWSTPSPAVYQFETNVTTPRDVYTELSAGKIVALEYINDAPGSVSSVSPLLMMMESNGTYMAYFINLNNDFDGVQVNRITSSGIDDPFRTT